MYFSPKRFQRLNMSCSDTKWAKMKSKIGDAHIHGVRQYVDVIELVHFLFQNFELIDQRAPGLAWWCSRKIELCCYWLNLQEWEREVMGAHGSHSDAQLNKPEEKSERKELLITWTV